MNVPNWQHHSRKDQKRKLKPQALRDARRRRQALLRSLGYTQAATPRTNASDHFTSGDNNNGGSSARPFSIALAPGKYNYTGISAVG